MSDKPNNSGFLDRWSSRKRQNEKPTSVSSTANELDEGENAGISGSVSSVDVSLEGQARLPEPSDKNQSVAEVAEVEETEEPFDPPLLTDDDMPPIESLSSDSDLSGFFNKGVSAALRKAALRHVFQQPKYNVRDGLNDYDGDYTVFEPLGDTVTSDMKWHIARKERERLEALELEEQERKALEQQETEDNESGLDEQETVEDEVLVSQHETHAIESDETAVSAQRVVPAHDDSLLVGTESLASLATENKAPSERVAGKLRRTDRQQSQTKDKTLQLADASQEHQDNAQDHEE